MLARETGRRVVEVFESKHPCSLHIDTIRKTVTALGSMTNWAHRSRLPRRCVQLHGPPSSRSPNDLGTSEECAAVVAFLCSERASFVTGEIVNIDGGGTRCI